MKKICAIFAVITAIALTGCELGGSSDSSENSASKTERNGEPTAIYGLCGDVIYTDEIESVITEDWETGGAELFSEDCLAVNCKGFIYLSEPSGICFNDRDNADSYNETEMSFSGISDEKLQNYKRVNVGETFCGLTLRSASTNFQKKSDVYFMPDGTQKTATELGFPEILFAGGECEFDGELTLEGYACAVTEDVYGISAGDIIFVPGNGCTLPVMSYNFDKDAGFYHDFSTNANFGMVWANEYGTVYLGNTESASADISCLPKDGTFVKVRVTVKNIVMRSGVEFGDFVDAEIADIAAI